MYGRRDVAAFAADGTLQLSAEVIAQHHYRGKAIPSALFAQEEAAHLAAVLFTNSGTISKFNRIGTERGYGAPDVAMVRLGTVYNTKPNAVNPRLFGYVVGKRPDERETFSEGLHILHNPWARTPLPPNAFRNVTEHWLLDDGRVYTATDHLDPFVSRTLTLSGVNAKAKARRMLMQYLDTTASEEG